MNLLRSITVLCLASLTFSAASQSNEARWESAYLRIPSATGAQNTSRYLDQAMHYAGTPGDRQMAVYMRDRLTTLGVPAHLERFSAIVYTPKRLQLQLLTSPVRTFDLREGPVAGDPEGARADAGIPFNAGSGSADVRARLIYANRGLQADYAALARAGLRVRGRILLVRYGAEFRGNLAKRAQEHGAAGVIFYSDPRDDGYKRGPVYPHGRFRPATSAQRGAITLNDATLEIPVLPVTLNTADALIRNMAGSKESAARVHLLVEMNAKRETLWNTVGELPGRDPGQVVLLGGHRDAWVYGITDNGSGIAALIEIARGFGKLYREGWRPQRSIRIIGFDGEEIGELGSRAYVAAHRAELARGAIAYINLDEAASGPRFGAGGAAALGSAIANAAKSAASVAHVKLHVPGGGSDFERFIYGVGTPIADIGFGGPLGTYHSSYDDFNYAARIADPGFLYHRRIAQVAGLLAMRLADAPVLPYRFTPYVNVLSAGARTLAAQAAARHIAFGAAPLNAAIAAFAAAASHFDGHPNPASNARALHAAQLLDRLAYSSNGYASVAFPDLAKVVAAGSRASIDLAIVQTAGRLNQITAMLR